MAKFYTSEEVDVRLAQIEAVLDGTVLTHGTAITDLQDEQVRQADEITSQGLVLGAAITDLQDEQVSQEARIAALEGA